MKIFLSESIVDYKTYTFNYALYCRQDKPEETADIYKRGFLPYSNSLNLREPHYYLARSLRVALDNFKETSENRRLDKKMQVLSPVISLVSKENLIKDPAFKKFCMDYAANRFDGQMSEERFNYIINWPYLESILKFETSTGELMGYVFGIIDRDIFHYWFSFYELDFPQSGLGKWMMYKSIEWAKDNHFKEVYLGTCYGEKAMYKIRDFKGLEFFDGNAWSNDIKKLKLKCKTDSEKHTDDFKRSRDK